MSIFSALLFFELNEEVIVMKASLGSWIGWIGIVLAVVGFFYYPLWFGGAAVVLGLLGLTFPQKFLAWSSIVLGAIAFFLPMLQ